MTDKELMQQALGAMQWASDMIPPQTEGEDEGICNCPLCVAIVVIRARLREPEVFSVDQSEKA